MHSVGIILAAVVTCTWQSVMQVQVQAVTYDDFGDIDYQCLRELDYEISRLSSSDQELVSELSFVYVMYRHGVRHSGSDINNYFTSKDISYECNEKVIWGSTLQSGTIPGDESEYRLEFNYVENEQPYSNSNCANTQIADAATYEMMKTGEIVANRYFNSDSSSDSSDDGLETNWSDQFDASFRSSKYIKSKAINVNRVTSSHVYFMNGLLGSVSDENDAILAIETHEYNADPFRNYNFRSSTTCPSDGEYLDWVDRYNAAIGNSDVKAALLESDESQALIEQFESEGGIWTSATSIRPINDIAFAYCADIDIPLSEETFDALMDLGRNYDSLFDESDEGIELNQCYFHQVCKNIDIYVV